MSAKRCRVRAAVALATAAVVVSVVWPPAASSQQPPQDPAEAALTPRLKSMLQAMKIARERHFLKPENPQLLEGAIRGLLTRLDPEAELMTAADMRSLQVGSGARYDLGLTVRRLAVAQRDVAPGYRVVSARDGSPAARAGLRAGDLVSHVDGVPSSEIPRSKLATMLAASDAGFLALRVLRQPGSVPVDLLLQRELVRPPGVEIKLLGSGIAHIRVSELDDTAAQKLSRGMTAAHDALGDRFSGVILDLRDTAGGLLDPAVAVADAFLDAGTIGTVEGRSPSAKASTTPKTYQARSGDIAKGKPIVVLINAGTARSGEVLAAALKDNGRATLLGTPSQGLAGVQSFVMLGANGNRGVLFMTTERYLAPSGAPINKGGVKPDKTVPAVPALPAVATEVTCRDGDRPETDGAGQCVRRSLAEDAVLRAALDHLHGASAAAPGAAMAR